MYAVSDAYKEAILKPHRSLNWYGTITTKNGVSHPFETRDIVKGSGTILHECSGNSALEIGTVYAAELTISIFTDIDRYELYDAEVELMFSLGIGGRKTEVVPMGIFTVSEAMRESKVCQIKAYDNMLKFEKKFSMDTSGGTPYDWLKTACDYCDVQLGMKREDFEQFPNGTLMFTLDQEAKELETWRDAIAYLSAALCAVATIDRRGKLKLVRYGMDKVMTIPQSWRFGSKFSDYETRYTAVNATHKSSGWAEYFAEDVDDALTYNLGVNPFLQFGLEETRHAAVRNILHELSKIKYTPFTSNVPGDPALDPTDVLEFTGGQAVEGKLACITSISYKINGKTDIKCVGENPRLAAAKSKNDKNISGLLQEATADHSTFYIYNYKNVHPFSITDQEVEILSIEYATVDATRIEMIFTSNHTMILDGEVVVRVYIDETLYQTFTEYESAGKKILTINFTEDVSANKRYNLRVTMQKKLYISDRRRDVADRMTLWNYADAIVWSMARSNGTWSAIQIFDWNHIEKYQWDSLSDEEIGQNTWNDILNASNAINPSDVAYTKVSPDETLGSIEIEAGAVGGVIFGRGLASTDVWNGAVKLEDTFPRISFSGMEPVELHEKIETLFHDPTANDRKDQIDRILMTGMFPTKMSETLRTFNPIVWHETNVSVKNAMRYPKKYITDDEDFRLRRDFTEYAVDERRLDRGRMISITIERAAFDGFEEITVHHPVTTKSFENMHYVRAWKIDPILRTEIDGQKQQLKQELKIRISGEAQEIDRGAVTGYKIDTSAYEQLEKVSVKNV